MVLQSLVSFLRCVNSGVLGTDSGKAKHLVTLDLSLLFIYLSVYLSALGLSCGMRDLRSSLQHEGSLVVA